MKLRSQVMRSLAGWARVSWVRRWAKDAAQKAGEDVTALRAQFVTDYEDTLANPYIAAERGYIDTVISPSNTRMNVTRALRALRNKRESLPPKKHGNIPL